MIIAETTLTPETGEYGYLLTFGEDYEWPPEWPIRLAVRTHRH
ncbi:hypothetical protein [Streptomyces sp. NPDC040750]